MLVAVIVAAAAAGPARAASAVGAPFQAFAPESVTFVSSNRGWVLGVGSCARGRCFGLLETTDGGTRWSQRPLPTGISALRPGSGFPGAVLSVRFADPLHGWISGNVLQGGFFRPRLWVTEDGGRSWRLQRLAWIGVDSSILDLEAAAGTAYLLATTNDGRVTVASSPVASGHWRRSRQVALLLPAGGAEASGSFVLEGARGWLVEGNDRGTSGSARLTSTGAWTTWTPPCRSVGGTFAVPAVTGNDMAAVCVMGGFASPLSAAAPRGARLGSSWLYISHNAGGAFTAAAELSDALGTFFGPVAEPVPGAIILGKSAAGSGMLEASFDGGRHWTTVAHGPVVYLGFTTSMQGVAITQSPSGAHAALLMSFDGGHRWQTVALPALRD